MQLVFVYGLQKQNERRNKALNKARLLKQDQTAPHYTMFRMLPANIPIIIARGITSIHGEIYAVDTDTYNNVFLKGENVPYFCIPKKITTKSGMICTIFIASPNIVIACKDFFKKYPVIPSGSWDSNDKENNTISLPPVQCKC